MAGFYRLPGVLAALIIGAVFTAFSLSGTGVLAQTAEGGVEGSAAADMPDFPIPSKAGEAYSPIGEGFESPIEPRADLKAAAPPPEVPGDDGRRPWLGRCTSACRTRLPSSATPSSRRTAAPIGSSFGNSMEPMPRR